MKYPILKHCAFLTLPTSISTYLPAYMLMLAPLPLLFDLILFYFFFFKGIWKESGRESRPGISVITLCMNPTPSSLISQPASHFQPQVFARKPYKIRGHPSVHLTRKKLPILHHISQGSDNTICSKYLVYDHHFWHSAPDFKHFFLFAWFTFCCLSC